jgi:hypothetical protein
MIGGEMTKTDAFTLSLLNNQDLLEILNHTHSARQLYRKKADGNEFCTWFTTHENGSCWYIGLFNLSETNLPVSAAMPLDGKFKSYNIWKKTVEALPPNQTVKAVLPPHGSAVYKITRAQQPYR